LQAKSGIRAALSRDDVGHGGIGGDQLQPKPYIHYRWGRAVISQIVFVDIAWRAYLGAPPARFDLFDAVRIACSARAAKACRGGSRAARRLNKKLILM
jgi:hypothetical protein